MKDVEIVRPILDEITTRKNRVAAKKRNESKK